MDTAFPVLETNRLRLREVTRGDASSLFELYSDPRVLAYHEMNPLLVPDEAAVLVRDWAEQYGDDVSTHWGITLKSSSVHLLGTCSCVWHSETTSALLGYDLRPEWWGQGIIDEAVEAVLAYTFDVRSFIRVQAVTSLDNLPSIRLLRRLGFTELGVLPHVAFWKGEYHDLRCFSRLASEWAAPLEL